MKTIVVTGCSGFIGSWICDKAMKNGHYVIGIDNLSSGIDYTLSGIEFYKKDLNSDISEILSKADIIVHAAAHAELRNNWKNKEERDKLFLNNECATRSLLEQMPDIPIIFLSTAAVYGSLSNNQNTKFSLRETDANAATIESPYAASKFACEAYIAAWAHKKKINWHILRLVNQIGPGTHRGVIVDFLKMIKDKNHIHAADSGIQKKNWVSVEDTADLIVNIIENKIPSGIYTVTSNERWSWRDIIHVMKEILPNSTFTLTCENCIGGAIGDPLNLNVSGDKLGQYYLCNRSIKNSVVETLKYLGWK
jgi:UDP-glucose 4-epimerase